MNPVLKFKEWYTREVHQTNVKIPSACCLSTLGEDGYPNARYLSLKAVKEEHFVITGPLDSRKGKEIFAHPKVALTFWWPCKDR